MVRRRVDLSAQEPIAKRTRAATRRQRTSKTAGESQAVRSTSTPSRPLLLMARRPSGTAVISKDRKKPSRQQPPKVAGMQSYPVSMQNETVNIDVGKVVQKDTWKLCREFGKKGSGPGEFGMATGIAAAPPDEIAVADSSNGRVVIFTNHGRIKNTIPEHANDVAATPNHWVVTNSGGVKVYNKKKTLLSEFSTVPQSGFGKMQVYLISVAVRKNGNIIVGDGNRKVLTEHSSADHSLIHTIPVEIQPDFLTVMNDDRIVISSWSEGRADIVDIVDCKAVTAATIQPTIGGQAVEHCTGVSSNSSGIYVATMAGEVDTGHIHHYDGSGHFVSCVARGLYTPHAITFTADGRQLAAADIHSVKMYHKV